MNNKDLATFVPRLECFQQHSDGLIQGRHIDVVMDANGTIHRAGEEPVTGRWGCAVMLHALASGDGRGFNPGTNGNYSFVSVLESLAWIVATPSRVIGVGFNGRSIVGKLFERHKVLAFELPHEMVDYMEVIEKPRWIRSGLRIERVSPTSLSPMARLDVLSARAFPDGWQERSSPDDLDGFGKQIAYAIASSRLSDAGPAVRPHLEAARQGDWSTDEDGRVAWFVDPDAPAEGAQLP